MYKIVPDSWHRNETEIWAQLTVCSGAHCRSSDFSGEKVFPGGMALHAQQTPLTRLLAFLLASLSILYRLLEMWHKMWHYNQAVALSRSPSLAFLFSFGSPRKSLSTVRFALRTPTGKKCCHARHSRDSHSLTILFVELIIKKIAGKLEVDSSCECSRIVKKHICGRRVGLHDGEAQGLTRDSCQIVRPPLAWSARYRHFDRAWDCFLLILPLQKVDFAPFRYQWWRARFQSDSRITQVP